MEEVTLESLAKRVAALETQLAARPAEARPDDWWSVVGMFAGSEFHDSVVAEGAAIRQAERDAIAREDGGNAAGGPTGDQQGAA